MTISPGLTEVLGRCDLLVANLECPLTRELFQKPTGVPLRSDPRGVQLLADSGVTLANLANNHISDCGEVGLAESLEVLRSRGISTVGAGSTLPEASAPFVFQREGGPIAFLGLSYWDVSTVSMASKAGGGANPLDLDRASNQIRNLREKGNQVVVSYHGGWEFYRIPNRAHRALMRAFSDAGAAIVVGHHGHVFLGHEKRGVGLVCYGLGDFFLRVERNRQISDTDVGMGLLVEMDSKGLVAASTFFVRPDYGTNEVGVIGGESAQRLWRVLALISDPLEEDLAHAKAWRAECARGVLGLNEREGPSLTGFVRKARDSIQYLLRALRQAKSLPAGAGRGDPVPSLFELGVGALRGIPELAWESHRLGGRRRMSSIDPTDVR